jgi:hypothetical protein
VVNAASGRTGSNCFAINSMAAEVTSNIYCGERRELNISTADFALQVTAPSTIRAGRGAKIHVEFSSENLRLLSGTAA